MLSLSNSDIKEEHLLKLNIVGNFEAQELNDSFRLNKFNIFCKYENKCLHIHHSTFIEYPPGYQSLYIPFIYKKFIVKLY